MHNKPIAAQILARLIDRLGQQVWLGMSDSDRLLVEACCLDAADLQLLSLQTDDTILAETIRREKAHVVAQLSNLSSANGIAIESAIWEAASRLLVRTGSALLRP